MSLFFFSNHEIGNVIVHLLKPELSPLCTGAVVMVSYIGNCDTLGQRKMDCGSGKLLSLLPGWWKEKI